MKKIIGIAVMLLLVASPAWAYDEGKVTDGGTITGKVTYKGSVPTKKIVPTKDTDVCGGIRERKLIVVSPEGGVKGAVVFLKGVEKGKSWDSMPELSKPEVNNIECRFEPHVQVARAGGEVTVTNSDPVLHNTHAFLDDRTVFNIAMPFEGLTVKKQLRKPGLVRVECDAHGWMLSWIYAVENPYATVTGEDGSYRIESVPPGTYTIVIWQEHKGTMEKKVTVKSGKEAVLDVEL